MTTETETHVCECGNPATYMHLECTEIEKCSVHQVWDCPDCAAWRFKKFFDEVRLMQEGK